MPIWALLYLFLFLALNVRGNWEKLRRNGLRWGLVVDLAGLAFIAWLFVAYWYSWSLGRSSSMLIASGCMSPSRVRLSV
jgi:hypothetical protein